MIATVETISELGAARSRLIEPVGLVPTMGYLHEGHLSLVRQARLDCQSVVVSIFINPTQFGPAEDLHSYPRNVKRDLQLLESVGCDLVWLPTSDVMYPGDYQTWVLVEEITKHLEGEIRPGHFRGVVTIVAKLFNAVQPQKAYFGQKDAQQTVVIKRMTRDLNFPIEIVIGPIIREHDGLAMSSRNSYLSPEERESANVLYLALQAAKTAYENGERISFHLKQQMKDMLDKEPRANIQYVEISDPLTLTNLDEVSQDALFSLAGFIGETRLIDNFLLEGGKWQIGKIVGKPDSL